MLRGGRDTRRIPAPALLIAVLLGVVAAPATAGDTASTERGARLFAHTCAACHGTAGRGDGPAAADLAPPPRDLTANRIRFRSTPTGAAPRAEDLERTIRDGLPGSSMPGFGTILSTREISDVIAFIDSLRPDGAVGDDDPIVVPVLPAADAGSLEQGRALYLLLECWRCHGTRGGGRGPAAATLTDELGRPIRSTDFRHDPFKGGREPVDVARTLLTGLNGAPMPSYEAALMFTREDLASISTPDDMLLKGDARTLESFLAAAPGASDLAARDDAALLRLRDERLAALTHYVLSLDRRRGFWSRLVHHKPEREPR